MLEKTERLLQTQMEQVLHCLAKDTGSVGILFCSERRIQELNREFRQMDAPTDILSWLYADESMPVLPPEETPWGELAICVSICKRQAEQSGWGLATELQRLIVHGLAHLAGYDHETPAEEQAMVRLEADLLSRIGLAGIYGKRLPKARFRRGLR